MIWPFSRIQAHLEWRRKDREETVVATARYRTEYEKDGKPTGLTETHVVSFKVDGNGLRYSDIDTTSSGAAGRHDGVVYGRTMWRAHGRLPDHAMRVDRRPKGKLVLLDGGKPDRSA